MSSAVRIFSRRLLSVSPYIRTACVDNYSGKARKETMDEMMARTDRITLPENITAGNESRVTMLSLDDEERLLYITKYSPFGFTLNNGINLYGPSVFFPNACFSWRVSCFEDIHESSLSLFTMLEPKPDLLIIGTGRKKQQISPGLVTFLRKHRLNFEVLTTDHAIATFNFQVNDQRWSAAALIPPEQKNSTLSQLAYQRLESRLDSTSLSLAIDVDLKKLGIKKDDMNENTLDELMAPRKSDTIWADRSPLGNSGHLGSAGIIIGDGEEMEAETKGYSRVTDRKTQQIEDGDNDDNTDKSTK